MMKTIYTTSSFSNWILACIVNVLIIWLCSLFAHLVNWKYADMGFFLYFVILVFYFICLKLNEGFPALFRKFVLRKKFDLVKVSAYEVTIILVAIFHVVRAIVIYKDALSAVF
ncbi:hypothetical protein [Gottfriedia acidiceleris]|uniref:Uncharacterized protein n=1 Tax=Gottfriedia acidiceleris TaxID=371036 RepID=A0ABY4JNH8_9BACI|nr:hypothetical protein [Gottfriedia acidiceleris]UPM55395.1 hypothetical protein MY490_06000 [Gottfriedia acidiceleris]